MRTLLLSKLDEAYLEKCAQEHKFAYGIIIGHQAELDKCIVVHLARNNEEDADLEDITDIVLNVEDVSSQTLAAQWLSASKMCPGSFDVIGIFLSSVREEIIDEQSDEYKNAKKLFSDVCNLLVKSDSQFGLSTTDTTQTDFVFLAYNPAKKKILCKTFTNSNGGTFSPMDCRLVEKPFEWISIECNYELDDVYPIFDTSRRISIEQQFHYIVQTTRKSLTASEIFLQNEAIEDQLQLHAFIKKKREQNQLTNRSTGDSTNETHIRASVILPVKCQLNKQVGDIKVKEFGGTLRLAGMISSRIYCNPRNTIADMKRFLRDDIMRSLVTRIQVYCDGLTNLHVSNEALHISEPPRRVYFSLPVDESTGTQSPVQFSEYIFRGEAPTVAVAQAKQILDVDIDAETIHLDVEGLPEDTSFATLPLSEDSNVRSLMPKPELSRTMYMLGIMVALLVLFVSVGMHYFIVK